MSSSFVVVNLWKLGSKLILSIGPRLGPINKILHPGFWWVQLEPFPSQHGYQLILSLELESMPLLSEGEYRKVDGFAHRVFCENLFIGTTASAYLSGIRD